MRTLAIAVGAGALASGFVAGQALAADAQIYHPQLPPAGDALYAPASVVTASVDVFGGFISGSGNDAGGTGLIVGGAGRASIPIRNGWNLQLDVAGMRSSTYGALGANNLDHTNISVAAGLYRRTGWGAFGFGFGDDHRASADEDYKYFFAGIAGSGQGVPFGVTPYGEDGLDRMPTQTVGGGDLVLTGNVSVGWLTSGASNGVGLTGQLGLLWWASRNTSLTADAMVSHFSIPGNNTTVLTGALGAAHRFRNSAFGVFGQARVDSYSGDVSATTASLIGGVRVYVDQPGWDARTAFENGPMITRLALPWRL